MTTTSMIHLVQLIVLHLLRLHETLKVALQARDLVQCCDQANVAVWAYHNDSARGLDPVSLVALSAGLACQVRVVQEDPRNRYQYFV
jgi:hypothetical protein